MKKKRKSIGKAAKTNTWALVAAVLVATFSLLFNQLFRITPHKMGAMKSSLRSLEQVSREFVAKFDGGDFTDRPDGLRSPKQVADDLEQLKPVLEAYFKAFVQGQSDLEEKAAQAGAIVRSASDTIEAQVGTMKAKELRRLRVMILENLFLVAGMLPDQYSEDLDFAAARLLAETAVSDQEPFHLLLAYHQLRIHHDDDQQVLDKLRDYSSRQPDEPFAIKLYALVANGMQKYERRALSTKLLRQGMEIYATHEERSRLVNVLIDLKMEDLAPPH